MNGSPLAAVQNALVEAFGDNAGLALELYAQYRLDPASVDASWRQTFREYEEGRSPNLGSTAPAASAASEASAPVPRTFALSAPAVTPAPGATRSDAPGPRAGEDARTLTGGAALIAKNMEASLAVPTATSYRTIPVKALEENRTILNRHREALGLSKLSFTHLVAWGIVRAVGKHGGMNDAYAEVDGKPARVRKPTVNVGIAVDVQKKDGSRTLLVPNVKGAGSMTFVEFVAAFDALVQAARRGTLSPDAFQGTTISLTNPGTVGTTASAPRLMPGQGCIVATGAMGFPPEFAAMPDEVVAALGISRVMNVSSTYDHRIIQGAESGQFLATLQDLLQGGQDFYAALFAELKVPYRPVAWEKDTTPPFFAGARNWEAIEKQAKVLQLVNAYRVRGHLVADVDPLRSDERIPHHADLDLETYGFTAWDLDRTFVTNGLGGTDQATLRRILEVLRQTYCGKIGAEFMYIADPVQKRWLIDRMEATRNRPERTPVERKRILSKLVEAESFEKFLHTKYVGHKRFSLEGAEGAVALLDRLLDRAGAAGVEEAVIGMPHRGRLTVLATVVGKPVERIFGEFEDVLDLESIQGSGDVKYHLGAVGRHVGPGGEVVAVGVAPNPSHLEFVDPVVEGMVRAKQERLGDTERRRVLAILLHGDAAFAGQGIVAETFNMSQLEGYRTGGTIHLVVNNQIGFTTNPADARSAPYCTDVAKMVQAPVFHVNADDPEAIAHVVDLAVDYQRTFARDVVVDLVCYRRYGHNEGDEPSYTQPLLYQKIKAHPSVARLYQDRLVREGVLTEAEAEALWAERKAALDAAHARREGFQAPFVDSLAVPEAPRAALEGGLENALRRAIRALSTLPEGFEVHPKLAPVVRKRAEFATGEIDWAGAELLAFGVLLQQGTFVRLSGQDSQRGTFSQRHATFADYRTGVEVAPLNFMPERRARFEVLDSLLSEAGVMGFEFGFSVADPSALVLWEAQFGDFANGAQVIVDQFVSGSEQKWAQRCGLVLLLPHGQEGQGPEHSSARLERFLTLCAEENLRVVNVTTPAQYFHALLRQVAEGSPRKPLVVLSPKSLLRHPKAVSRFADLAAGSFQGVLDDAAFAGRDTSGVRRVAIASGKVVYDLLAGREKAGAEGVAILRLEQTYPFPGAELGRAIARYPRTAELAFVQEEPRNMGAWRFVREQFLDGLVEGVGPDRTLRYVGRRALASPAPGSHRVWQAEQDALVAETFRVGAGVRSR